MPNKNYRLWLAGNEMDTEGTLAISISGVDLSRPNTVTGSYTNEVELPITANNSRVLGVPTDFTAIGEPVNRKYTADVSIGSIPVLESGVSQITRITPKGWAMRFYGGGTPLFELLKKRKLADIDYSTLDHEWALAQAGGTVDYTTGYCYPTIQYGRQENDTAYDMRYTLPALYVRWVFEKLMGEAGYTLVSDIWDTMTQRLLVAWGGDVPKTGERFRAQNAYTSAPATSNEVRATVTPISVLGGFPQTFNFTDYLNYYPWGYSASYDMQVNFAFTGAIKTDATLNNCTATTLNVWFCVFVNNVVVLEVPILSGAGTTGTIPITLSATLSLLNGDVVEVGVRVNAVISGFVNPLLPADFTVTTTYYSASNFRTITTVTENLIFGSRLNFEALVPDMTQADFVKMVLGIVGAQAYANDRTKELYAYKANTLAELPPLQLNITTPIVSRLPLSNYGQLNYIEYKNNGSVPAQFAWAAFSIPDTQLNDRVTIMPIPLSAAAESAASRNACAYIKRWVQSSGGTWESNGGDKHALLLATQGTQTTYTDGTSGTGFLPTIAARFNAGLMGGDLLTAYFGTTQKTATGGELVTVRAHLRAYDFEDFYNGLSDGSHPNILRPVFVPELNGLYFISKISEFVGDEDLTEIELLRINPLND